MQRRSAVVLRKSQIRPLERLYVQRLHPGAEPFPAARLSRDGGLERVRVSQGRLAPGAASFAYHAHLCDEEWIYIVEGAGIARIDGHDLELAAGDFVAFPVPSVAHQLRNPHDRDLVYLFGGEDHPLDILDYPDLGKRFALAWDGRRVAFHPLGPAEYPFERLDQPPPWRVLASAGYGSAIIEAALAVAGVPYVREAIDMDGDRAALRARNPLGQLPTVVLPDGTVMTESAAIVLRLAELVPAAELAPPPAAPERAAFLRWLVYFAATIYPTYTYEVSSEQRAALWRPLEAAAGSPWFLGERFSALDLYVAVMTRWRPGPAWFAGHAPRLAAIAEACARRPELAAVWAANFA